MKYGRSVLLLVTFLFVSFSSLAQADALSKADLAVANILFDFDGSDQFASYRVNDDGFVNIVFARNMPDKIYGAILTGVLTTNTVILICVSALDALM